MQKGQLDPRKFDVKRKEAFTTWMRSLRRGHYEYRDSIDYISRRGKEVAQSFNDLRKDGCLDLNGELKIAYKPVQKSHSKVSERKSRPRVRRLKPNPLPKPGPEGIGGWGSVGQSEQTEPPRILKPGFRVPKHKVPPSQRFSSATSDFRQFDSVDTAKQIRVALRRDAKRVPGKPKPKVNNAGIVPESLLHSSNFNPKISKSPEIDRMVRLHEVSNTLSPSFGNGSSIAAFRGGLPRRRPVTFMRARTAEGKRIYPTEDQGERPRSEAGMRGLAQVNYRLDERIDNSSQIYGGALPTSHTSPPRARSPTGISMPPEYFQPSRAPHSTPVDPHASLMLDATLPSAITYGVPAQSLGIPHDM